MSGKYSYRVNVIEKVKCQAINCRTKDMTLLVISLRISDKNICIFYVLVFFIVSITCNTNVFR